MSLAAGHTFVDGELVTAAMLNIYTTNFAQLDQAGTWTVTDVSGAGLTIANTGTAQYIKHARLVFVSLYITYPSTANGSTAALGGLPYSVISSNSFALAVSLNTRTAEVLAGFVSGGTSITFSNNSASTLSNANMSTVALRASGCYIAAS